jgi:hypothetical protein
LVEVGGPTLLLRCSDPPCSILVGNFATTAGLIFALLRR